MRRALKFDGDFEAGGSFERAVSYTSASTTTESYTGFRCGPRLICGSGGWGGGADASRAFAIPRNGISIDGECGTENDGTLRLSTGVGEIAGSSLHATRERAESASRQERDPISRLPELFFPKQKRTRR